MAKGSNGVNLEDYKKNITAIVDEVQAAGVKIIILTPTMLGEDPQYANNIKLVAYIDFLKQLANEKKYLLCDLNGDMQIEVKNIIQNILPYLLDVRY